MQPVEYLSTPAFPLVPASLHLAASFHTLQVEQVVAAQHAKRRGGPKKVWLSLIVVDDRSGAELSSHVLVWKTISQKNFSNQNNIKQYERNCYGAMRLQDVASGAEMMFVAGGARTGSKVANAIGVNTAGVALESHPRFLLSSGKGEEGARSSFLFYHSNPHARIQLQRVWIEHKELRITFEQSEGVEQIVGFAPKFRTTYTAKESHTGEAASSASASSSAVEGEIDMPPAAASAAASAPLKRDLTVAANIKSKPTVSLATAKKLRALPPVSMPPALMERLNRKRSAAESSNQTLDSPVASDIPVLLPMLPLASLPVDDALPPSAPKFAKVFSEGLAGVYPSFSGYDETFEEAMGMRGELDLQMGLAEENLVTAQQVEAATPQHADESDATPRLSDSTPPPFLHQLTGESDASDSTQSLSAADAHAEMQQSLDQFEERLPEQHQQSQQHSSQLVGADLFEFNPMQAYAAKQRAHEQEQAMLHAASSSPPPAVPMELATASAKDNPFSFTAYSAPQGSPSFGAAQLSSALLLNACAADPLGMHLLPMPFMSAAFGASPMSPAYHDLMLNACRRTPSAPLSVSSSRSHKSPSPHLLPLPAVLAYAPASSSLPMRFGAAATAPVRLTLPSPFL